MSSSKVRPAWADSSTRESAQEEAAVKTGAPQENHTAVEPRPEPQTPTTEPSYEEAPGDTDGEHLDAFEAVGEEPGADHDGHAEGGAYAAPSFGKKNSEAEARQENSYPYQGSPRSGSGAPAQLKAAISSFAQRISGGRTSAPKGASPGAPQTAEQPVRHESPEQVEKRLKVSLRETTIEGFRRIAFGSPKGGVGKSSLAYTVAGAIASCTNLRVCLVDADPNFGATRYLVPRPVEQSVLDLADDAERLERLADLRTYVSQNEQMGLDVLLNPIEAAQISSVEDLAEAYAKVDAVLSQFYDWTFPGSTDTFALRCARFSHSTFLEIRRTHVTERGV